MYVFVRESARRASSESLAVRVQGAYEPDVGAEDYSQVLGKSSKDF